MDIEVIPYLALPFAVVFSLLPGLLARWVGVHIVVFNLVVLFLVVAVGGGAGALLSDLHAPVWSFLAAVAAAAILAVLICLAGRWTVPKFRMEKAIPRLFVLGAGAGALTLALKAAYGGWLILIESLFLGTVFATVIFHVALRGFAVSTLSGRARPRLLLWSDALLLLSALLRWDVGDGSPWLTMTAMVGARGSGLPPLLHFSENVAMVYNAAIHLPVAVAWIVTIVILMRSGREPAASDAESHHDTSPDPAVC